MTLKYWLNEINNKHCKPIDTGCAEYIYQYNFRIIKQVEKILKQFGFQLKEMKPKDLKGRHVNRIMSYWLHQKNSYPVLKQKYNSLVWLLESVDKVDIIKPLEYYVNISISSKLEFEPIKGNFDHILLPSKLCLDCNCFLTLLNKKLKCSQCHNYVGIHASSQEPLGYIANSELRIWRMQVHKVMQILVDKKLKNIEISSGKAKTLFYNWLAGQLDIPIALCHIGYFDEYLCKKAFDICSKYV